MTMWEALAGLVLALVAIWVAMVVTLYLVARREQDVATWREAVRLAPDVVRLLRRLAADPGLPRGVRWRLLAVLVYLVLPIDLVPDFIPVVGFADDAVIVVLAVRSVVRASGPDALDRHWPGTPQGLAVIKRLAGV